ncbi:MAG: hypothetical protein R2764_02775 [Bacteroidales bacterium]
MDINGTLDVDAGTFDINGLTLNCYDNVNVNNGGILHLLNNSTLALHLSELHVNNGGWLMAIATAGNDMSS